jgi:hypothetical protein
MSYEFKEALKIYNKTVAPFEKTLLQKQLFAQGRKHLYTQIVHGEYYTGQPDADVIPFSKRAIQKVLKALGY